MVDIAGSGVMLCGESGSGKSDLALRLIDRGACLVTDDQICLTSREKGVYATAPKAIRGYLEIRGLGVVSMPVTGGSYIRLIVHLTSALNVPRLPDREVEHILGAEIHCLKLNAFEHSTPIKIELALRDLSRIGGGGPGD
ncbi:HPr kinase/phosphatase C-terminal domain-containing protein [Kordiimonas sp. SCSIO 12603]|nr:HPr kinase/phosphatase C-terminal domain-containing protein [Kordiimonas sp. SCSIO 12603]